MFGVILFITITGCDTLSHGQYLIEQPRENVQLQDKLDVIYVIADIANRFNLSEKTKESHIPNTIVYYKQSSNFPINIGARIVESDIVIDCIQFHPGVGDSAIYSEINNKLASALKTKFGNRLVELKTGSQIAIIKSKKP
jgi:hypothetical protein